jgi:predicted MPP superfamily phosphohydrolase
VTLNLGYLAQQCVVLALSLLLAAPVLGLLWLGLRRRPHLRALGELFVVTPVLLAVGMRCFELGLGQLLRQLGGRTLPTFLAIGLAFWWLVLWWPLRVLLARRRLTGFAGGSLKTLAALSAGLAAWGCLIEPLWLDAEPRRLVLDDVRGEPIRLAHVSDLQLIDHGPREDALVAAIRSFEPHVIVLTGDYITAQLGEDTAVAAARAVLAKLRAPFGVYATTSDSDDERQRRRIFDGLPIQYLLNRSAAVTVNGTQLRIGGLDHFMPRWSRLRGECDAADELYVMAAHTPDLADECLRRVPETDLFLCGHTHGGQLQVPGIGPLLTMSRVSRRIAAGGVFALPGGRLLALSRGVGMEGNYAPRFRINCRPHVFLFTLAAPPASR